MNNSADDNRELFDAYKKSRSIEDRNRIVEKYLYIVNILVKRYLNRGVDYDDLYQVGSMALVLAADRYDCLLYTSIPRWNIVCVKWHF